MSIFSITLALFLVMDPLGNAPIFISMLRHFEISRQQKIIFREHIFALIFILLFFVSGEAFLHFLNISESATCIAAGIILFIFALPMVFPDLAHNKSAEALYREPFLTPLALPLIAGPSTLTAVVLYSKQVESNFEMLLSIFIAWLLSLIILVCSPYINKLSSPKLFIALERLMGLILMMLSIERLLTGIKLFIKSLS